MTKLLLLTGGWTVLGHDAALLLNKWLLLWLLASIGFGMIVGAAIRLGEDADG